jgi:hypothetical protein
MVAHFTFIFFECRSGKGMEILCTYDFHIGNLAGLLVHSTSATVQKTKTARLQVAGAHQQGRLQRLQARGR